MQLGLRPKSTLLIVLATFAGVASMLSASSAFAQQPTPKSAGRQQASEGNAPQSDSLAQFEAAVGDLLRKALPSSYEKKEDWGQTKNITVGLRTTGKGFNTKIKRRKKPVNHGVWKHYRVNTRDSTKPAVDVSNLRLTKDGQIALTLTTNAHLDFWARAKVYNRGIHLIALEAVGDTRARLTIQCELGLDWQTGGDGFGLAIVPRVTGSQLQLQELHIRRVSNAKGPLVRELSSGVRRLIQRELGPDELTAKLNRAIDKKRDRLRFAAPDLLNSDWRWLARFAIASPPAVVQNRAAPSAAD